MNKKGDATDWPWEETGRWVLRIIVLIVLIIFLISLISIFYKQKPVTSAYQDLERITAEIQDLSPGETINVPLLSVGYKFFVFKTERLTRTDVPGCKVNEGDYCTCIKKTSMENCLTFKLRNEDDNVVEIPFTASQTANGIAMDADKGLNLRYYSGKVTIS